MSLKSVTDSQTLWPRPAILRVAFATKVAYCLLQEVGGEDLSDTVLIMLYHVKEANAVFMTKVTGFAKNLIEKVEVHICSKSYSTD